MAAELAALDGRGLLKRSCVRLLEAGASNEEFANG